MSLSTEDLNQLADVATEAARAAGAYIREARQRNITPEFKDAGDCAASQVVTEVDRNAQAIILERLAPITEQYQLAVLTEESPDDRQRQIQKAFWCIDPMDGTLAFVQGDSGFSTSIGLTSRDGQALLGVVYDPIKDDLYRAVKGGACLKNGQALKLPSLDPTRALILQVDPTFKKNPWLDATLAELRQLAAELGLPGAEIEYLGGGVLNACIILSDANRCYFKYPRAGKSGGSLWDYAASACLTESLGGVACDMFGEPMELNRPDSTFMNHKGILYTSHLPLKEHILALYQRIAAQQ